MSEQTTSISLLQRFREPTPGNAWERLVNLYTPLLHYWAHRLGLREEDAHDLVQDVFATLIEKLPEFQYRPGGSFRGWLRIVLRNTWLMSQRRCKLIEQSDETALAQAEAAADNYWDADWQDHLVRRALELMQADFQFATWKACWEVVACSRPAAEVARELGLTVGAVHAARFRVLARLRQELAGMMD